MIKQVVCKKCNGAGQYMYDEHPIQPCEVCCTHPDGWHRLERNYGKDNGKYSCKRGCGTMVDEMPDDEESLMTLTKDALTDILGREPTRQEILRAHAGFRRMAYIMFEHIKHKEK